MLPAGHLLPKALSKYTFVAKTFSSHLPLAFLQQSLHEIGTERGPFYVKSIFLIRKNLLILEILFQREAASHDGGEFGIIHDIGARVVGEVFFHDLFSNPANAGGNAGKSCGVHDCFHKLVVRHVDISEK